jgi:hypothetical protein
MFLKKMKRIANANELNITCHSPFPVAIHKERDMLYDVLYLRLYIELAVKRKIYGIIVNS